jgi:hypothetical protein
MTTPTQSIFDTSRFKISTDDFIVRVEDDGTLNIMVRPDFATDFIDATRYAGSQAGTIGVLLRALIVAQELTNT